MGSSSYDRQDRSWVTEVVRRIQRGEGTEEDYERLFRAFEPALRSFLLRRGWSEPEAEDIIQNVFFRVYLKIGSFRLESSFDTWILKIMANSASNEARKKRTEPEARSIPLEGDGERGEGSGPALHEFVDHGDSPLDSALAAERLRYLQAALAELPLRERQALVFHVLGETYEEIAELRNVSAATVKKQVQNGRRHLRDRLGPHVDLFVLSAVLLLLLH